MVVAQPLLDDRLLFGAKAELLGTPAGITDGQHPYGMTFSVGANGAAGAMPNDAVEQGTADDLGGEGKRRGEFGALAQDCLLLHLYK